MTQELRLVLRIVGLLLVLAGILTGAARADTITYFHNDISGSPVAATDANGRLLWKEPVDTVIVVKPHEELV